MLCNCTPMRINWTDQTLTTAVRLLIHIKRNRSKFAWKIMLRTSINLKAIRFVHTCSRQHMQQPEILMKSRLKNMESLFFRLPKSFRPSACARLGLIQLGQCLWSPVSSVHSQYFHQPSVCQKETYNPISGATRPKLGFRSPFGKFGLSEKIGRY